MAIVTVGGVRLQVKRRESRREFVVGLIEQIEQGVRQLVARCLEEALEAEVTEMLGRGWYERRRTGRRQTGPRCNACRSRDGWKFRRDGHYPRYLDTCWGRVRIGMPQLECECGGYVSIPFQTVRPRQRVWDDVEGAIRQQHSGGQSLRQIKEQIDERLRSSVGLRTLNERVRMIAQLVPRWRSSPVASVPPVVRVDGIWLPLMRPTGRFKPDRLGRWRAVKQVKKVPVLIAQGVWPACREQQVVAWVLGEAEDEASWEALLTQMWQRGLTPEAGLCLLVGDGAAGLEPARRTVYWDVPFQRCIFHKLKNLHADMEPPQALDSTAARAYRRRFLRQAARIWHAPNAPEARRRHFSFCQEWAVHQPTAVATLCRDFDQTLTFYHVRAAAARRGEHWSVRLLRTTSLLERELRVYRRRFDNAVLFHSFFGLAAVIHSLIFRRRTRRSDSLPLQWHRSLERALAVSCGIS